jgi:hypothetical protein
MEEVLPEGPNRTKAGLERLEGREVKGKYSRVSFPHLDLALSERP